MTRRRRFVGFRLALVVCLGLYAGVLLASPGLHHDFDCHLKTPGHCQACVANPLAPRTEPASGLGAMTLVDYGRPFGPPPCNADPAPLAQPSGRAPPR